MNPITRHQLYREIEQYISDHALLLPLFHEQTYRFALKEVQEFEVSFSRPVVPYEKLWIQRQRCFQHKGSKTQGSQPLNQTTRSSV